MILAGIIAAVSLLVLLCSMIPNRLLVIDSDDQTIFTATVIEIIENNDSIDIRLDFHDHTVFYSDTFRMDTYNYQYAIEKGFLDEVDAGDIITIMTNPNNGPYYYYQIFSLEKDDKFYLTIQETNEGLEVEKEAEDAKSKKTIMICAGVFAVSTLISVMGYLFRARSSSAE